MRLIEGVKGFARTVSGAPPLTLPNCVDTESVMDYTIEGASGGVGDVTENLFDNKRKWDAKGSDAIPSYGSYDATYIDGGGYHMTAYDSILFNFTNLIVGETYTISWDLTTSHSGQNICMIVAPSITKYKNYYSKGTTRFSQTFTATATTKIAFGFINQAQTVDGTADITNIMLVQGSTEKTYEPYGYKMPIVCRGKNLLDLPYTTDNRLVSARDYKAAFSFKVEVGKTYTFSMGINAPAGSLGNGRLVWCLSYVDNYANASQNHVYVAISQASRRTFTATQDTVYFIPGSAQGTVNGVFNTTNEYWDFMLEEGSAKTTYEKGVTPTTTNIYLDAPLEDGEVINYKEDNLPKLPTVQGTTIYTVETEVQPSNMIVTYYATAKE